MKKVFGILLVLVSLVSFPSWAETKADLVKRGDLYFKKFSDVPFSGEVQGQWQGYFLDGKKEGEWTTYHDNGQLESKGFYKDGRENSDWIFYFDNGQKATELAYELGKKTGYFIGFYPNGSQQICGSYLNDKIDGYVYFYDNNRNLNLEATGIYSKGKKVAELELSVFDSVFENCPTPPSQ